MARGAETPSQSINSNGEYSMYYTYLVGWTTQQKYYYGVRYAKNSNPSDLWKTYFTSSKYVKRFVKEHGDPDIIQIRKTFENKKKAILWESIVLQRMNVIHRNDFLNRTDSKAIVYDIHPLQGKHHSKETKRKISEANLGKKRSKEVCDKMSKSRSGKNHWNYGRKWDEETKRKNRESNIKARKENPHLFSPPPNRTGQKHSEETKKKIAEGQRKYWANQRSDAS